MNTSIKIVTLFVIGLTACKTTHNSVSESKQSSNEIINSNKASAIYWQQNSAEYEALCYQAFNFAGNRLNNLARGIDPTTGKSIVNGDASKPIAIVMDLDETILDNSLYLGYLLKNNLNDNPNRWREWINQASAELIPGAKEFIEKANQANITIFYISNRTEQDIAFTVQNLAQKGINFDPSKLLVKRNEENKFSRRNRILSSYDIVMLIGDNLSDFTEIFESELEITDRKEILERFKFEFGNRFIIIPNVLYGDWELKENLDKGPNQLQPLKDLYPYIKSYK